MRALFPNGKENGLTPNLHRLHLSESKNVISVLKDLILGMYLRFPRFDIPYIYFRSLPGLE
jgi:hypothetical protein